MCRARCGEVALRVMSLNLNGELHVLMPKDRHRDWFTEVTGAELGAPVSICELVFRCTLSAQMHVRSVNWRPNVDPSMKLSLLNWLQFEGPIKIATCWTLVVFQETHNKN